MPFTSPASLSLASRGDPGHSLRGYIMLFRAAEAEWVTEWYEDLVGAQLPEVDEWLANAREEHTWFCLFMPSRGEPEPAPAHGSLVQLDLEGRSHEAEWIDDMRSVMGGNPFLVLAGTGEAPEQPEPASG